MAITRLNGFLLSILFLLVIVFVFSFSASRNTVNSTPVGNSILSPYVLSSLNKTVSSVDSISSLDPSFSNLISNNEYICPSYPCALNSSIWNTYSQLAEQSGTLSSIFSILTTSILGILSVPLNNGFDQVNQFIPGAVSGTTCIAPSSFSYYGPFLPSGSTDTSYSDFTGFFGYPQESTITPEYNVKFPSLFSGIINLTEVLTFNLAEGSVRSPYDEPGSKGVYNIIEWGQSSLHYYPGTSYMYAESTDADLYVNASPGQSSMISGNTFIVPAISCGATATPPVLIGTTYAVPLTSGFVPAVGLAAQSSVGSIVKSLVVNEFSSDDMFWSFYQYEGQFPQLAVKTLKSDFNFTEPSLNYAAFPPGNDGDSQYINNSGFFSVPVNATLFFGQQFNQQNFFVYESNNTILTYQTSSDTPSLADATKVSNVSAYSVPNLVPAYWPFLGVFGGSFGSSSGPDPALIYDTFKVDGILPVCNIGNGYSYCTMNNATSVNPISPYRLWDYEVSGNTYRTGSMFGGRTTTQNIGTCHNGICAVQPQSYSEPLNQNPYAPGYDPNDVYINTLEEDALNSFCFYGDNFDTSTGVYDSPSYTRIIPPLSSENYTVALGKCNGFFNSTDCFGSSNGNYLNFESGIFLSKVSCTSNGIYPTNVTDAWISSVSIANNAGQFCGYFGGKKAPVNPVTFTGLGQLYANNTVFTDTVSSCPSFNNGSAYVNLLVTVQNVGNSYITAPYLYVLYGNVQPSQMFYAEQNTPQNDYELYQTFLLNMNSQSSGLIQLRYLNGGPQEDMFFSRPGNSAQDIPISELFSGDQEYVNGPYNNSLLGMWLDYNGKIIRTSNTFLSYSNSGNTFPTVIIPGGKASFDIEIPLPVFEMLLKNNEKIGIYFGNMFNVNWWNTQIGQQYVPSSTSNSTYTHNTEYLDPSSSYPMPIWQYIVGSEMNIGNSVFKSVSIYSDSFSLSVSADNNNASILDLGVSTNILKFNGSGLYNLTKIQEGSNGVGPLSGSSLTCFATQDNMNDFDVFWSVHAASSSNLKFLMEKYYGENAYQNEIINIWRGLVFMPYASNVVLNYNNLPYFPTDTASFSLEEPAINSSSTVNQKIGFVSLQETGEQSSLKALSDVYHTLNTTRVNISQAFPTPASMYGFSISALVPIKNQSILKIGAMTQVSNSSPFSDIPVSITLLNADGSTCLSGVYPTDQYGVVNITEACSGLEGGKAIITSPSGPFSVTMYNNTPLNITNTSYNGAMVVAGNFSSFSSNNGYRVTLNLANSVFNGNGVSFTFSYIPESLVYKNSLLYLYYLNGTPFNCNPVDENIFGVSTLAPGEYRLYNGSILCSINSPFNYLRAVFFNVTNGAYLGGGDIESGLMIAYNQSSQGNLLKFWYNGKPVTSQDVNMSEIFPSQSPPYYTANSCVQNQLITNGVLNLSDSSVSSCSSLGNGQNYTIDLYVSSGGVMTKVSAAIFNLSLPASGSGMISMSPQVVLDAPSGIQNLTINNPSVPTPVFFSVASTAVTSCNDIRLIQPSGNAFPYEEIPFQVVSNVSLCDYVFIARPSLSGSKITYEIYRSTQPAIPYSSNWGSFSNDVYYYKIKADNYSADLLPNCMASLGPCLSNVTAFGKSVGTLLLNNASAYSTEMRPVASGPVMNCIDVLYTSSYTLKLPVSGFGGLNYNLNRLYQIATPSQQIISSYCFFRGSDVILDYISMTGPQVPFSLENKLNTTFISAQSGNGLSMGLPKPISTSCLSSTTASYTTTTVGVGGSTTTYVISPNCLSIPPPPQEPNMKNVTLPSSYFNTANGPFFCLGQTYPTYTPQFEFYSTGTQADSYGNYNNMSGGLSYLYTPGNYSITTQYGNTIYYDTCIPPSGTAETVNTLNEPKFYFGSSIGQPYDGSSGENYLEKNVAMTAIKNTGVSSNILFNPNGGELIGKCPINTSISDYTFCIKPVGSQYFYPTNSYPGGLEGLPNNRSSVYNYPIGGGCLVDTNNPSGQYYCAPTFGNLSNSYPGSTSYDSVNVSSEGSLPYEWSSSKNSNTLSSQSLEASFSCSGQATVEESESVEYYEYNTTTGNILNPDAGSCTFYTTQNEPVSCSYNNGMSSGSRCSTSFSNGNLQSAISSPSTEITLSPVSYCKLNENPAEYSTWYVSPECAPPPGNATAGYAYAVYTSPSEARESVVKVYPYSLTIYTTAISLNQGENTTYYPGDYSDSCQNGTTAIKDDVGFGWSWHPYMSYEFGVYTTNPDGIPLVGGCEANRDTYDVTNPTISVSTSGNGYQYTYSCPSGYSGSILSCENESASRSATLNSSVFSASCTSTSPVLTQTTQQYSSNSPYYGAACTSCASLPSGDQNLYQQPNPQASCLALPRTQFNSTMAPYVLQYSNDSNIGIGLGVLGPNSRLNITLPGDTESTHKDLYMTSLSEVQTEAENLFLQLYPFSALNQKTLASGMEESFMFPFDLLDAYLLQNPYFGVSGEPGFINGSVYDDAMNIFSGGTQYNCPSSSLRGNYGIYALGEGVLCDGNNLPSDYVNGIYASLGTLNEGPHAVQFYSVSAGNNSIPPTVGLYSSGGRAVSLNTACSNGNSRSFTFSYDGTQKTFDISSDDECDPINNLLYGYIINCMYQTPENQTYNIGSVYYLAYDLPTVWDVSYTLLVSPRSYNVVPVKVKLATGSSGSYITIG